MSDSNRTIRERMMDRVVLRYLGLILLVAIICPVLNNQIIVPYVVDTIPIYPDNPSCLDLPAPLGGNHRSLLAYNNNPPDALDLDLDLSQQIYTVGRDIQIILTVTNTARGPVVFLLPEQAPIITTDPNVQGLTLELTNPAGQVLTQPGTYQPSGTLSDEVLHVIGAGARCQQRFTINWTELQALGVGVGDYRIRVTYRNNYAGAPEDFSGLPTYATPITEYVPNQGVWTTSGVTSNEVRFSITPLASTPPPAQ